MSHLVYHPPQDVLPRASGLSLRVKQGGVPALCWRSGCTYWSLPAERRSRHFCSYRCSWTGSSWDSPRAASGPPGPPPRCSEAGSSRRAGSPSRCTRSPGPAGRWPPARWRLWPWWCAPRRRWSRPHTSQSRRLPYTPGPAGAACGIPPTAPPPLIFWILGLILATSERRHVGLRPAAQNRRAAARDAETEEPCCSRSKTGSPSTLGWCPMHEGPHSE